MSQQSNTLTTNLTSPGALNSTVSSPRTTDQARALYLKLFSGEMFKGFQNNTIARDLVMKRTLKNGKSLQFIYTGRTKAEYHTPGNAILGNTDGAPPVAEKTITCDDLLISSAFVYQLDEVLAHYDLRSEISRKIGYALAEKYDRLIFRAIAKGARQASPISKSGFVEPGGSQIQVGSGSGAVEDAFVASKLITAFYDAAAAMDEKGVSQEGRVGVLSPRQYYSLIQQVGDNGLVNRDVQGQSLQSGNGVIEIAGIKIYKSMNIPFLGNYGVKYSTDGATLPKTPDNTGSFVGSDTELEDGGGVAGMNNNYGEQDAFDTTCGLIFQKEAAGVVEAMGPQVQVTSGDVSVIYQGDVMLGRLAMGADFLNPACAVELHSTSTAGSVFGATYPANA